MSEKNNIVYERTVQLHEELKNYVEAVQKKIDSTDLKELKEKMGTMKPEELKDRAFDILATKQLHNMDISTLQTKFVHFYEAHVLIDQENKFPEQVNLIYNDIKRSQVKPFYTLDKDGNLTDVEKGVTDKIRENFRTYNMDLITQELEKELKNIE